MSVGPYVPTTFSTPVVTPAAGGAGTAPEIPYISPSEYTNYPTSMSTQDLVPLGSSQQQSASFFDLLQRASYWMDRIALGTSVSTKGASLRASLVVESAQVNVERGQLKLICDYQPVLEVRGVDVGVTPQSVASVGPSAAAGIRFGRRTIYVPYQVPFYPSASRVFRDLVPPASLFAVWSYIPGYPHTSLASGVNRGDRTCTLTPTDGAGGLFGIYPGTRLQVVDGIVSEAVTVQSVSTNVVTTTAAFLNAHVVPTAPDFISVTGIPDDLRTAGIYLTTGLLKTRGDEAMLLEEVREPRSRQRVMGDLPKDFMIAIKILQKYSPRVKAPR